jgi:hypothetical protein
LGWGRGPAARLLVQLLPVAALVVRVRQIARLALLAVPSAAAWRRDRGTTHRPGGQPRLRPHPHHHAGRLNLLAKTNAERQAEWREMSARLEQMTEALSAIASGLPAPDARRLACRTLGIPLPLAVPLSAPSVPTPSTTGD